MAMLSHAVELLDHDDNHVIRLLFPVFKALNVQCGRWTCLLRSSEFRHIFIPLCTKRLIIPCASCPWSTSSHRLVLAWGLTNDRVLGRQSGHAHPAASKWCIERLRGRRKLWVDHANRAYGRSVVLMQIVIRPGDVVDTHQSR
jgi:hypothetical protein